MQPSTLVVMITAVLLGGLLFGGSALADDEPTEAAVFYVQ
jgi:hypothetical protein